VFEDIGDPSSRQSIFLNPVLRDMIYNIAWRVADDFHTEGVAPSVESELRSLIEDAQDILEVADTEYHLATQEQAHDWSTGPPRESRSSGRYKKHRRRFHAPGHFGPDPRLYNEHGEPRVFDPVTGDPVHLDLNATTRLTPDARHLALQLYDLLMAQIHSNPMLSADAMRFLNTWQRPSFEHAWASVTAPDFQEKLARSGSGIEANNVWTVLHYVNRAQRQMENPPVVPPEALDRLYYGTHVRSTQSNGPVPTFRNIQQAQISGPVNNPAKRDPEDWTLERMSWPQAGGHFEAKKHKFRNEHGKKVSVSVFAIPETAGATVRMILKGPHSTMTNDITLLEARYLHKALSEFLQGNTAVASGRYRRHHR
jgi:hypothetical protein